jgi:queuine/archaeosine tRNA-ribosyltransferase
MGVGTPLDLIVANRRGHRSVRLRDAHPQRQERPGLRALGKLTLKNARYRDDPLPIDPAVRVQRVPAAIPAPTSGTCSWRVRSSRCG